MRLSGTNGIQQASAFTFDLLGRMGGSLARDTAGILMLHGVHDEAVQGVCPPPSNSVSVQVLENMLRDLHRFCSFISMDELVAMWRGAAPWRKGCLALTFDDSLKCNADLAAPLLVKLGIPACFYLSTEVIDKQQPYWWLRLAYAMTKTQGQRLRIQPPHGAECEIDSTDRERARKTLSFHLRSMAGTAAGEEAIASLESQVGVGANALQQNYPYARIMTWEDARQLVRSGMTVGSHTVSHPDLTLIDPAQLRWELETSKRVIEKQCRQLCDHHCYPFGHYSETVRNEAAAAGFVSAVTTQCHLNRRGADLLRLGRTPMCNEPWQLKYMLLKDRFGKGDLPKSVGNSLDLQ